MPDTDTTTTGGLAAQYGVEVIESIERNEAGQLVVKVKDRPEPAVDARVARCFPWSLPDTMISIRDKDGKELALLRTLDDLPAESRRHAQAELDQKVFNPRILRVSSYKNEFGVASITADTDRGEVTFQIRSRDDVRLLSPTRALFRDADGSTFELANLDALDVASRRWLSQHF